MLGTAAACSILAGLLARCFHMQPIMQSAILPGSSLSRAPAGRARPRLARPCLARAQQPSIQDCDAPAVWRSALMGVLASASLLVRVVLSQNAGSRPALLDTLTPMRAGRSFKEMRSGAPLLLLLLTAAAVVATLSQAAPVPEAAAADAAAPVEIAQTAEDPTLRTAFLIGGLGGVALFAASTLFKVRTPPAAASCAPLRLLAAAGRSPAPPGCATHAACIGEVVVQRNGRLLAAAGGQGQRGRRRVAQRRGRRPGAAAAPGGSPAQGAWLPPPPGPCFWNALLPAPAFSCVLRCRMWRRTLQGRCLAAVVRKPPCAALRPLRRWPSPPRPRPPTRPRPRRLHAWRPPPSGPSSWPPRLRS